jgi:hypothetical protein
MPPLRGTDPWGVSRWRIQFRRLCSYFLGGAFDLFFYLFQRHTAEKSLHLVAAKLKAAANIEQSTLNIDRAFDFSDLLLAVKKLLHGYLEARQEARLSCFARATAHRQLKNALLRIKNVSPPQFGVDDPVFLDAILFVEVTLFDAVPGAATKGYHLRDEVGRSVDRILNDREPALGDEDDVRLGALVFGQHHVDRSCDHFTEAAAGNPGVEGFVEAKRDFLMLK